MPQHISLSLMHRKSHAIRTVKFNQVVLECLKPRARLRLLGNLTQGLSLLLIGNENNGYRHTETDEDYREGSECPSVSS